MKHVSFFRQNHPGQSHPGAPEKICGPEFPESERAVEKEDGEEQQPDFVNGIAAVKNEAGRSCHRDRGESVDGFADKRLKFQREPDAANADEYDRQPQGPEIAPKQSLRQQEHIEMERPVIIGRVVFVVTVLDQLIDKPAVDPFVEMGRLHSEQ